MDGAWHRYAFSFPCLQYSSLSYHWTCWTCGTLSARLQNSLALGLEAVKPAQQFRLDRLAKSPPRRLRRRQLVSQKPFHCNLRLSMIFLRSRPPGRGTSPQRCGCLHRCGDEQGSEAGACTRAGRRAHVNGGHHPVQHHNAAATSHKRRRSELPHISLGRDEFCL